MNSQDIIVEKKEILQKLTKRQLKSAIDQLYLLSAHLQSPFYTNKLIEIKTNYQFMLHYQFEGIKDPEQTTVYFNFIRLLFELTDDITDELLLNTSSNLFFEKSRISLLKENLTIQDFEAQLKDLYGSWALTDLLEDEAQKISQKRNFAIKIERIASEMFTSVYISKRADDKDYYDYLNFMKNADIRDREKCLFISALTLNLMRGLDFRKVRILMDFSQSATLIIRQRAIVGLIIILHMYDVRWNYYPECKQQLESLSEDLHFRKSVLTIVKQLIRSRETEKISKKLTEEIIPEMMKFNSLAGKKLNMDELMGMTDDFSEKNPEWKKELENSGLADKLQEYSNLQMEGADVFHSTFANLKSFPFFSDFNNWFLPFDTTYSEIINLFSNTDNNNLLYTAVVNSGHMCNSDKYSFCLSLLQMPESQRGLMMHRFGAESEELKQLQKEASALNPTIDEEVISNQYIQDLYRFFKLYPSKSSFFDIFKLHLNFYDKKSIAPLISKSDDMRQIALYCFDKNFFSEALIIYQLIVKNESEDAAIWQKIAYCHQMMGDSSAALNAYLQADLINPGNSWTMKRIAQLYRSEKKYDLALDYFLKLQTSTPNNISIELNIGHCYLDLKEYDKALNTYFKVELFDGGDNPKAWRPIAWVAFLMKKYDLSQRYYQLILNDNPTVHDYLNAGHVELALENKKAALSFYQQTLHLLNNNIYEFENLFMADKDILQLSGANEDFFSLLFDELNYRLEK